MEFANAELTLDKITRKHGAPASKQDRQNYSKQATQARVCVLQAKEYFDAARSSSLYTSANHAYYGSVALASLAMLILGDGTKSLDYLRSDKKNNHHGLNFSTGCDARTAASGIALIEQSYVEPLEYGHFPNWYKVLPSKGNAYAFKKTIHGTTSSETYTQTGQYDVLPYEQIKGKKSSIIGILQYLPDLDPDLQRCGVSPIRSRTTHEIEEAENGLTTHTWRIHGCRTADERDVLLEEFKIVAAFAESISCHGTENTTGGIVRVSFSTTDSIGFRWPISRETMNHNTYSYVGAPEAHEITDLYQVAYQLSMLSRYFPDIWVACIESQCRAAKLIERAVDIIVKKLPILALSMISYEDVVISTHREPWFD